MEAIVLKFASLIINTVSVKDSFFLILFLHVKAHQCPLDYIAYSFRIFYNGTLNLVCITKSN